MSVQIEQMKHVVCNISGRHKVPQSAEKSLYENGLGTVETNCERCKTPLRLQIDEKNSKYYQVIEI